MAIKFADAGGAYGEAVRNYHTAEALDYQSEGGETGNQKPTKHVFFKSILKPSVKSRSNVNISRPITNTSTPREEQLDGWS